MGERAESTGAATGVRSVAEAAGDADADADTDADPEPTAGDPTTCKPACFLLLLLLLLLTLSKLASISSEISSSESLPGGGDASSPIFDNLTALATIDSESAGVAVAAACSLP